MRVLLITCQKDADYLSCMMFDGLQELLGEQNVVDAVDSPWLHRDGMVRLCGLYPEVPGQISMVQVIGGITGRREGERLFHDGHYKYKFDLVIVHSACWRDQPVDKVQNYIEAYKKPEGKIAYIEGWDAPWQVDWPQPQVAYKVDAYFRKEIEPYKVSYPMKPHHLNFAAPSRWIADDAETRERPLDVFWLGNPNACLPGQEVRWPMLGRVFQTAQKHRSIIATYALGYEEYFAHLRNAKLALCPSGADLTDCLRTFEAVACGSVPVFVGYPERVRDPWFPPETCFSCTVDTLVEHLEEALKHDLAPRRKALMEHVRKYHTTKARAAQLLEKMGMWVRS